MSWKGRALYLHAYRRRKKPTWNSTPHYKAEKETVTGEMVVKAIMTTLGPQMKAAGVKWIFADNDSKSHQQQVMEAWAFFLAYSCGHELEKDVGIERLVAFQWIFLN